MDKKLEEKFRFLWSLNFTRYIVLILSTVCLSLMFGNSLALNFTVICMKKYENHEFATNNSTNLEENFVPMFLPTEQSLLFSAVAIGTLIATLPQTYLISKIGIRGIFTSYGLLNGISTLLIPVASLAGFYTMFFLRVIQGFAVSLSLLSMGTISANWSPLNGYGTFISIISLHFHFGPMLVMPLSAAMCESETFGWQTVYYSLGSATLVCIILFFVYFRDEPRSLRYINRKELSLIENGKNVKTSTEGSQKQSPPYEEILWDKAIWGILVTILTSLASLHMAIQYGPVYLNKAVGLNVKNTGLTAAIPHLITSLIKLIIGPLSDRLTIISQKYRIILFAGISQYVVALAYLGLAFLPYLWPKDTLSMQICFTTIILFNGINIVGVPKGIILCTQQFSHILFTWCTFVSCFTTLSMPLLAVWFAPNNSVSEWTRIFVGIAIFVTVGVTYFNFTYDSEPRPWTKINVRRTDMVGPTYTTNVRHCRNLHDQS